MKRNQKSGGRKDVLKAAIEKNDIDEIRTRRKKLSSKSSKTFNETVRTSGTKRPG